MKDVVFSEFVGCAGAPRGRYHVTVYSDGSAHCTCPGWTHAKPAVDVDKRTCKHTRALTSGLVVA